MSRQEWTTGKLRPQFGASSIYIYDGAGQEGGKIIAEVLGSGPTSTLSRARLIAAAPDLLEACRACLDDWGEIKSPNWPEIMKAAIAKATGEEE